MLQLAWKEEMFKIVVCLPEEQERVTEYEILLKQNFNIRKALVVPGLPGMLTEMDPVKRRSIHQMVTGALAICAASYIDEQVRSCRGRVRLGVAWGRTMHAIADALLHTRDLYAAPEMEVVPIIGITSAKDPEGLEANVVAMDIARAFKGRSSQLPAPAFVMPASKNTMCCDPQIRAARTRAEEANLILTGIGPIFACEDPGAEMRLSTDEKMSAEIARGAVHAKAIGDMCGALFDAAGREVFGCREVIGLDLAGFRRASADPKRQVILVTGGDRRRVDPLRVALETGLASVVITDTFTAEKLLETVSARPAA
jgi:DNA-binding transcriptional regulator LsrR (DeoR family)